MALWKRKGVKDTSPEVLLNPKFKDFLTLPEDKQEELLTIFMKVKGSHPDYSDIIDMPLGTVIELKGLFKVEPGIYEMIEVCKLLTGNSYNLLVCQRLHDISKLYKFAIDGLNRINELEKGLIRELDAKDAKAGVERLNKFSDLISLKAVADFYNEKPDDSEKRPYKECFSVWYLKKEQADVERAYIKNQQSK